MPAFAHHASAFAPTGARVHTCEARPLEGCCGPYCLKPRADPRLRASPFWRTPFEELVHCGSWQPAGSSAVRVCWVPCGFFFRPCTPGPRERSIVSKPGRPIHWNSARVPPRWIDGQGQMPDAPTGTASGLETAGSWSADHCRYTAHTC